MKYGLDITPAGPWGRPDRIADLAALAEHKGWDGVFCEDYLCFPVADDGVAGEPPPDTYDVWITLALIAQATSRITLGPMVTPLPARKPAAVALQALTVDHVSGGRLVLGVGLGDQERTNFDALGQTDSLRERAQLLDEGLDVIDRLWSGESVSYAGERLRLDDARMRPAPVTSPRIPIWVGGALTKPRPRRRALRWDGACLYRIAPAEGWEDVTPDDVRRLRADAQARPDGGREFVIVVGGRERSTAPDGLAEDRAYVAGLAEAGADWFQEYVPPRLSYDEARRRIEAGPLGPPQG
jgi:alkanesulfonate monooxygenase SsuD/methylene tetrahydromethanopterin reductase-like flavin-dependent oxidoreductase (luciferase family)